MAEFPAMPFWTDAYLADTGHLTNEEHGLYLKLLILLWRSPGQRIPDNRKWIERRFRGDTAVIHRLIDEFCERGKWITQSKLSREFQYVAEKSEKQRDRINSRWDKEKGSYRGNTEVIPPTPTPTPTPIKKERKEAPRANAHRGPHLIPNDWLPTQGHNNLASQLGLSTEQLDSAACEMRDWSKGSGKKRTDWNATFNNWLRRNAQRAYKPNGRHSAIEKTYKTFRPKGTGSHADRQEDTSRSTTTGESLLDQSAGILNQKRH